jgi:hypothetical protein
MLCPKTQSGNAISFSEEEASKIVEVEGKLKRWIQLAGAGVVGAPSEGLKEAIMAVVEYSNMLYEWYVPPFNVSKVSLSENDLLNVISDLKSKGGLEGWLRLDLTYYTTDIDTFKKIVGWDWADTRKYISETFDCDKFSMYFKSRVAIDFGINSVGVVLDYSAEHAYNLVILKEGDGIRWYLYEPQNDNLFTYDQRDKNMYAMQSYYLIL